MATLNKDLGRTIGDPCCCEDIPAAPDKDRKYYPSFHYAGDTPLGISKRGKMVIEYEITSCGEAERDGKCTCSATIDVKSIVSADTDAVAPARSGSDAADALDAIAKELRRDEGDENEGE